MQWILLVCAGLLEIGWPLGFKLAGLHEKYFYHFIALSVVSMGLSGFLLYLAQKSIPIGPAYVIWTGIGAVGTVKLLQRYNGNFNALSCPGLRHIPSSNNSQ